MIYLSHIVARNLLNARGGEEADTSLKFIYDHLPLYPMN